MIESMLLQGAFKIILALLALLMARLGLLWFDHYLMPESFKNWITSDETTDIAKSVYFGLRLLGVCLLFGLAIS